MAQAQTGVKWSLKRYAFAAALAAAALLSASAYAGTASAAHWAVNGEAIQPGEEKNIFVTVDLKFEAGPAAFNSCVLKGEAGIYNKEQGEEGELVGEGYLNGSVPKETHCSVWMRFPGTGWYSTGPCHTREAEMSQGWLYPQAEGAVELQTGIWSARAYECMNYVGLSQGQKVSVGGTLNGTWNPESECIEYKNAGSLVFIGGGPSFWTQGSICFDSLEGPISIEE